ncbi:MAG: hypothetical protein Q9181_003096 [Wetmoreana brouardii]
MAERQVIVHCVDGDELLLQRLRLEPARSGYNNGCDLDCEHKEALGFLKLEER